MSGWSGWSGNQLEVDLDREKAVVKEMDRSLVEGFIGGAGYNAKILYDRVDPNTDPLGPDNVLCFGNGPLSGTPAPSSSRYTVTSKSPVTGIFGDSNSGGHWGPELHNAGFDHVFIRGRADKPVYLWIDDHDVELRDASELWGLDTWETTEAIQEDLGDPSVRVACIGPAGENLVKFACVISDMHRAAGRTGMGAVMGSKNLKAIAVRGTKGVEIAKPREFMDACNELEEAILNHPNYETVSELGTTILQRIIDDAGVGGYRHYQDGQWPEWVEECGGQALLENYVVRHKGCYGCPASCSRYYHVKEGPYQTRGGGPEYENVAAFGAELGNINLESILKCNTLSNKLGLDTMHTGHAIAVAMHLYQEDMLPERMVDGELEWGNPELIVDLVRKTGLRDGFGDKLALGAKKLGEICGNGAQELVVETKGMRGSLADIRSHLPWALNQCTATRGMDHLKGLSVAYPDSEVALEAADMEVSGEPEGVEVFLGKNPFHVVWSQNRHAIVDSTGLCKYEGIVMNPQRLKNFRDLIEAATNWEPSLKELYRAGERIYNIERAFNNRIGITRENDYPPKRFMKEPIPNGPAEGAKIDQKEYTKTLNKYYKHRGWDKKTGKPTKQKLKQLGLNQVIKDLYN
ncbi:aldehyde ferredoxin oxidoreductase family protein [Methanonatronarchaeum sp. AMET-Sl]|uniref:aldehyde ferredoxin oxidoreductase family protein n=1 Tax=Methanonatronarchaeum sp. AMET-Sl TaxID=3037654 RepID=UPI00244DCCE0|nr:aldehyde ferredoxin oxidoreductase family protein [Methanonatronarchaeum sp. AMET-Sl]WGI17613.1 aldehyde ferredoxin oxidoreductase family protein [Methanonatronarchaeum sp. AMET-Sl]